MKLSYILVTTWLMTCNIICQSVPVIFIHRGNSSYLQDSLWQARQYNQEVILLGDQTNNHYDVAHHMIDDYFEQAALFAKIYKHLHTCNSLEYELLCIQRWFILKNFMNKHAIERAFYCDSDVMLYCDVTQELKEFKNFDLALMYGDPNCTTSHIGHIALCSTYGIDILCNYITEFYTNKQIIRTWTEWIHAPERIYGQGISDMVILSEFVKAKIIPVGALNKTADNTTFDINLNQGDDFMQRRTEPLFFTKTIDGIQQQYRLDPIIKDIVWINNQPHAFNLSLNRLIRFKGLHFQGSLKPLMKRFRKTRV